MPPPRICNTASGVVMRFSLEKALRLPIIKLKLLFRRKFSSVGQFDKLNDVVD